MCYSSLFYCFSCYHIVGIRQKMSKDKLKHYRVSQKNLFKQKEFSQFFSRFFRLSCHLWTQFSQLLKGQFGKILCLSHREFPEFLKNHPTFISSPFQSGVIAKNKIMRFFRDTLYYVYTICVVSWFYL